MDFFVAPDIFLSQLVSIGSEADASSFETIAESYFGLVGQSDTSDSDGTNFTEPEEDKDDNDSTKNPPRRGSVWDMEAEAEKALMDNCDYLCWVGFTSHVILLALHIFINAVQLSAWADGSLLLLWGTLWHVFMTVWDVGLILDLAYFYELDRW